MAKKLTKEDILAQFSPTKAFTGPRDWSMPASQGELSQYNPSFGEKVANWFNENVYGGGRMAYSPARNFETPANWSPPGMIFNAGQVAGEELNKGNVNAAAQEFAMAMLPGAGPVKGAAKSLTRKAAKTAKNLNVIPDIRGLPVDDAIKIARREPHVIPAGANSPSAYLGAPRSLKDRLDLLRMRKGIDKNLADDPRGGDWYDRYRAGMTEVTGGNKTDQDWMSAQHGQYSAGVSPEGELGFAIKDNNANLMGMPIKVARPAQAEAARRAIDANDPELHQLGKKTGQYRKKVHPDAGNSRTATGVNDFRWAREFGYTDTGGSAQRDAMGNAQHQFMDYETALAVDRANKANLAGRSDWTGEQIQAAPWVRQKAYALMAERRHVKGIVKDLMAKDPTLTAKAAKEKANPLAMQAAMREAEGDPDLYEQYFQEANKSITEFFPKHTAYATHESIPGVSTGHLPGMIGASQAEKEAYTTAGSWAIAPGERDAIYAGLRRGETGVSGRVRPSTDMQGMWTGDDGVTQFNPGQAARPLVGFNAGKDTKTLADADKAMLQAGETLRAAMDAQDAGAAHIPIFGGKASATTSLRMKAPRKLTIEEMKAAQKIGAKYGMKDVVDTGEGITFTDFVNTPKAQKQKAYDQMGREVMAAVPGANDARRASIDSAYAPLVEAWQKGEGSGAVTDEIIAAIDQNPVMAATFNDNPYIGQMALRLLERDEKLAAAKGGVRKDLQNLRRLLAENGGKDWFTRLKKARAAGQISLPAVGALMLAAQQGQQGDE